MLFPLVIAFALTSYGYALGVIAPVYYNPGVNCSSWLPIISSIYAHPTTRFYLLIGLQDEIDATTFNALYDQCVPVLRPLENPNVVILGYANASSSQVYHQVDLWAEWNPVSRPTGILFGISSLTVVDYNAYISYARGKGFLFFALDRLPPRPDDYVIADLLITFDDHYANFNNTSLVISPSTPASKQAVLLSLAPPVGSYNNLISELASSGVGALYITDAFHSDRAPGRWAEFVSEVEAANKTSNGASTTTSEKHSSTPVGAIVGGVLGGVVVILIALVFFLWARLRRRRQITPSINPSQPQISTQANMMTTQQIIPMTVTSLSHPSSFPPSTISTSSHSQIKIPPALPQL